MPPLIVTGPYRYSRNPLYLGKLAINLGFALASGALVFMAVIPVWWAFLQWVVVPWEERALRRRFGKAYLRYLAETPRWVARPNLWRPRGER
jgi:protein-S-isoprenylcysteine O-methyltransferase Ste14